MSVREIILFWVAVTSFLVGVIKAIEKDLDAPEILSSWRGAGRRPLRGWILECNRRFVNFFQRIYFAKTTPVRPFLRAANSALWLYVVLATLVSVTATTGFAIMGQTDKLQDVLHIVLFGTLGATVAIVAFTALRGRTPMPDACVAQEMTKSCESCRFMTATFWIALLGAIMVNILQATAVPPHLLSMTAVLRLNLSIAPSHVVSLGLLELGIIFGLSAGVLCGLLVGGVPGAWAGVAAGLFTGFLCGTVGWIAVSPHMIGTKIAYAYAADPPTILKTMEFIAFSTVLVPYIGAKVFQRRVLIQEWQEKTEAFLARFSCPAALLGSLVAVACTTLLVSLTHPDVTKSFLHAARDGGWVFIALNLLADSFSIMETYLVLTWAGRCTTLRGYVFLVILDLVLSACIFLLIPVVSGTAGLLDGIRFRGVHPWLGILFWSTFGTSILFFLFLITAVLLSLTAPIPRLFNRCRPYFVVVMLTVGMGVVACATHLLLR